MFIAVSIWVFTNCLSDLDVGVGFLDMGERTAQNCVRLSLPSTHLKRE